MSDTIRTSRREFLGTVATGAAGLGLGLGLPHAGYAGVLGRSANEKAVVAIVGLGGRGSSLARSFARLTTAQVAYVCDPDAAHRAKAVQAVGAVQGKAPTGLVDFRRVLEDDEVDAVVIATPDHWHTPAAILAMQAGKHVYVEKPGSHNAREGELIVEAANRYDRRVQMGNQRRSWPKVVEGVERVRRGDIGAVHYARGWYANTRRTIGRGRAVPPPANLDYDLWQGPAPRTPYRDNFLHYTWHWFWRWGTAESGNNGVHALDLCRWGLGVDYPVRVASTGGRYYFDDDQETPDTQIISFDFPGERSVMWEGQSCNGRGIDGTNFGVSFHGTQGSLVSDGRGYRIIAKDGKVVEEVSDRPSQAIGTSGPGFDADQGHLENFLASIRTGEQLRSPIQDGQKSTLLCHLGNIAQRTGRTLTVDPATGRIVGDADAMRLWGREYAPGWAPKL